MSKVVSLRRWNAVFRSMVEQSVDSNILENQITLQFNLSVVDIPYCLLTIPEVRKQHPNISNVVGVVDMCKPPTLTIKQEIWDKQVNILQEQCEHLVNKNILSRVYYVFPNDPLLSKVYKEYLQYLITQTHDSQKSAITAYLVPFEIIKTKYLLHYDADMLLYQKPGYDWAFDSISWFAQDDMLLSVSPKLSPSIPAQKPLHPIKPVDWFSTRCFMINTERFKNILPLTGGKYMLEVIARKVLNRTFPPTPERMIYERMKNKGFKRFDLTSQYAWITHPVLKNSVFINSLPNIFNRIKNLDIPPEQINHENMILNAWIK
ncbi:MAG TPA: hypothetical protein PK299_02205 [Anaerolineales bacterium]|nr:hypothetical protein [Anaerolineales bacterium]